MRLEIVPYTIVVYKTLRNFLTTADRSLFKLNRQFSPHTRASNENR